MNLVLTGPQLIENQAGMKKKSEVEKSNEKHLNKKKKNLQGGGRLCVHHIRSARVGVVETQCELQCLQLGPNKAGILL